MKALHDREDRNIIKYGIITYALESNLRQVVSKCVFASITLAALERTLRKIGRMHNKMQFISTTDHDGK